MVRLAILFHRLGPYHLARCVAAGSRCSLTVIELSAVDPTYAWSKVDGAPNFERSTLFCDEDVESRTRSEVKRRVHAALTAADPQVVAVPGWSHPGALSALLWCLRKGRPAVLMSDSALHDEARRRAREATKRRVVRLFSGGIVAGARHRAYACALGLAAATVFDGYDVVDNEHFAHGARHARLAGERWRQRLGLPPRFFLACSRFVPKKNLIRLLDAYAAYRGRTGGDAWRLVLLGDGALRRDVERRVARTDLAGDVILAGFRQYHELPACYGLASAFVHASTIEQWGLVVNEAMAAGLPVIVSDRCGCARDLVSDGVNGFTFDPHDVDALTGLMLRVAAMTDDQRHAMGRAGQRIVAAWGPERFADGLMRAVDAAMRRPPPAAAWHDQALLWALARRPLRGSVCSRPARRAALPAYGPASRNWAKPSSGVAWRSRSLPSPTTGAQRMPPGGAVRRCACTASGGPGRSATRRVCSGRCMVGTPRCSTPTASGCTPPSRAGAGAAARAGRT